VVRLEKKAAACPALLFESDKHNPDSDLREAKACTWPLCHSLVNARIARKHARGYVKKDADSRIAYLELPPIGE
jgi:hypothetical protein